jgi:hypothetical protein
MSCVAVYHPLQLSTAPPLSLLSDVSDMGMVQSIILLSTCFEANGDVPKALRNVMQPFM